MDMKTADDAVIKTQSLPEPAPAPEPLNTGTGKQHGLPPHGADY